MNPDYKHLQRVVLAWRALRGMSQADVGAAGGPSDTTLGSIEAGKWSSRAPADTLRKLDRGFGWPEGTARRVLYEGFDPVEVWPAGRARASQPPLEFGPEAEWVLVLEDRLAHRRKELETLERQKADIDYRIRSLHIEIDYLLRERAELMHVAGPKPRPDYVYTDDEGHQHIVEVKRYGGGDIGENLRNVELEPLESEQMPAAKQASEVERGRESGAGYVSKAARRSQSVGRMLRRGQDYAAEKPDIVTETNEEIIDTTERPR